MGDAKCLAREAFQQVAGDRLLGRKSDRMHEAVELRPDLGQVGEHRIDLFVAGDVAVVDQRRIELGREFDDPPLETLADVAERQFRPFAPAGPGDAIGDRAVGEHARDQEAFAG